MAIFRFWNNVWCSFEFCMEISGKHLQWMISLKLVSLTTNTPELLSSSSSYRGLSCCNCFFQSGTREGFWCLPIWFQVVWWLRQVSIVFNCYDDIKVFSVDGVTDLVVLIDCCTVADSLFFDFVLWWVCLSWAMQVGDWCNESTVEGNWPELSSLCGE